MVNILPSQYAVLNLSEGFDPAALEVTSWNIEFESKFFSGGEPHIKLKNISHGNCPVLVTSRLNSMDDIGMFYAGVDALKRMGFLEIHALVPYFPAARQDRLMVKGEAFTSAIFVKQIAALGLRSIISVDLHSEVVGGMFAVLDTHFVDVPNHEFVNQALTHLLPIETVPVGNPDRRFKLISPDAGSNKKMKDVCSFLVGKGKYEFDLVKCDKTRDVATGKITGFDVYAKDLNGRKCVIVDDICDGGGTFLGLAEKLKEKGAGDIYLVVTHGIFSKGFKELRKHFKAIYTTDSIRNDFWNEPQMEKGSEIVKILPLNNILGC